MVKQTILIHGIVEKEGKTGNKYYLIDTDKGKMSCFPDYTGLKDLKKAYAEEKEIEVNTETSEDGKFVNIRNEKKSNIQGITRASFQSVKGTNYEKDPVGLAVEVFNALYDKIAQNSDTGTHAELMMKTSCDLVKQAQKAFS